MVNDLSSGSDFANKNIRFKTSKPRSHLSDNSDPYIVKRIWNVNNVLKKRY